MGQPLWDEVVAAHDQEFARRGQQAHLSAPHKRKIGFDTLSKLLNSEFRDREEGLLSFAPCVI